MSYRPRHFAIQELVYPEIYESRSWRCWELLDERALRSLSAIREKFGPLTVNDWHWGGNYKESGLRSFTTQTGAKLSQHRFGRAFDIKPKEAVIQDVYEYILGHPREFKFISTLENIEATPTWVHFDTRLNQDPGIRIVNP